MPERGDDGLGERGCRRTTCHRPQEAEQWRLREFGSAFEAAVLIVDSAKEGSCGPCEGGFAQLAGRGRSALGFQGFDKSGAVGRDLVALVFPDATDFSQNMREA